MFFKKNELLKSLVKKYEMNNKELETFFSETISLFIERSDDPKCLPVTLGEYHSMVDDLKCFYEGKEGNVSEGIKTFLEDVSKLSDIEYNSKTCLTQTFEKACAKTTPKAKRNPVVAMKFK